jgi:anaerobic ribonucleoside-triphosphate reductase activating protein
MLKFVNYSIVFQEVPNEVTLALNISGCPNNCKGCHSPYLREDVGEILDKGVLSDLLERYKNAITCVCFMGGDGDPEEIDRLSLFVAESTGNRVKTAWYSGKSCLFDNRFIEHFNYIKLGTYVESLGGLDSPSTNQRFYKVENGKMVDQTAKMFRKSRISI